MRKYGQKQRFGVSHGSEYLLKPAGNTHVKLTLLGAMLTIKYLTEKWEQAMSRWSSFEDEILATELSQRRNLNEIASRLGRRDADVMARAEHLGLFQRQAGLRLDQART